MPEQKPTQDQPVSAEELDQDQLEDVAGGDNTGCANVLAKCGLSENTY